MGKQPVRMKAVVYALSPFQQKIMSGLWNDLSGKIHHKISENWISAALLITPVVGSYTYKLERHNSATHYFTLLKLFLGHVNQIFDHPSRVRTAVQGEGEVVSQMPQIPPSSMDPLFLQSSRVGRRSLKPSI
ncbi:hypothetical protein Csa_018553 [Cucumis sativus]|nr:hypothetical protein Csa_018553 [Cucumis sativus]